MKIGVKIMSEKTNRELEAVKDLRALFKDDNDRVEALTEMELEEIQSKHRKDRFRELLSRLKQGNSKIVTILFEPDGDTPIYIGVIRRKYGRACYKIIIGTVYLSLVPDNGLVGDPVDKPSLMIGNSTMEVIWDDDEFSYSDTTIYSALELVGLREDREKLNTLREAFGILRGED
jgi:hypothetical protein